MGRLEARIQPSAEGSPHRLGLLRDLLPHVVGELALVEGLVLPRDRRGSLDGGRALERARLVAVGVDRGDLAVVEMDDAGGVPHERGRIGGEEHLAVADAQHERAAVAGHDQRVGPLGIDDGQPIGADDAPKHLGHDGLERRAVVHQGDEMGEHLGVGVGGEDTAALGELRAQRRGILDDAVVHDGVAAGAVAMGMGVAVARLAMGCPARMGDAERALEFLRLQGVELTHAALALGDPQLALAADRDAGRVVAAIFEPVQALEQDGGSLTLADIADNSAHGSS